MKKTLLKILVAVTALVLLVGTLAGCGGGFSVEMKDWGATDGYKNGGFVRETENYVYLINGQGSNTSDNTFGSPIKGALVAVSKDGFGTDSQKVEVVVPKLFVGTDYKAGIYIFGDYVYYATPSTDKNPDGDVANTNLTFMRTKLDGTDSKTYFTLEGLSTQFRVVKSGDDVYFIFYDSVEKEIATYNVTTGERKTVVKTDAEAAESLNAYTFVDNSATDAAVVIYTTTIYAEEYDKDKADTLGDDYSRDTETFNRVYAYKVGDDGAKLILDGKYSAPETERDLKLTYTVKLIKNGYVFYSQIDNEDVGVDKYFVSTVDDFYNGVSATVITNEADIADTVVFGDTDTVYKISDTKIVRTTFTGNKVLTERTVADVSDVAKIWFLDGVYIYYTTSSNVLMRVNVDYDNRSTYSEKELEEQRVSDGAVHTSWYAPETLVVGGKTYAMICDTTTLGASYVKSIDLGAEIQQTEEDGEITDTFIDSDVHVAVITDLDVSIIAEAKINEIDDALTSNGNIVFDTTDVNGKSSMQAVIDAREVYESLTKAQKKLLDDSVLEKIEKYEKAIEVSLVLDGLKDFDKAKTDEAKEAFRTAYETAKPVIEKLEKDEDGQAISSILVENYRWFYQEADEYFNPAEDED